MTQGQGEGKVKLHTMNLVAAGSPLTDKDSGLSVTLSLSLTAPFPIIQVEKKIYRILVNSMVHMGLGRDSRKISGTWVLCTLDG